MSNAARLSKAWMKSKERYAPCEIESSSAAGKILGTCSKLHFGAYKSSALTVRMGLISSNPFDGCGPSRRSRSKRDNRPKQARFPAVDREPPKMRSVSLTHLPIPLKFFKLCRRHLRTRID